MNFLKKLFLFSFFASGLLCGLLLLISPFLFYGDEDFNFFTLIILFLIGAILTFYTYKGWVNTYKGHRKDWAETGGDFYRKNIEIEKLVADKFKLRNLNKKNDETTKAANLYLESLNNISEKLNLDPKKLLQQNSAEELKEKLLIFKKENKLKENYKTNKNFYDELARDQNGLGFGIELMTPSDFSGSINQEFLNGGDILEYEIQQTYMTLLDKSYIKYDESVDEIEFDQDGLEKDFRDFQHIVDEYKDYYANFFSKISSDLNSDKYELSGHDADKVYESILSREICLSMPKRYVEMVEGEALELKKTETKDKLKETMFFDPYETSRGNTRYKKEVKLENGLVTAIKEL